jgi:trimeric autotransporter adhesin
MNRIAHRFFIVSLLFVLAGLLPGSALAQSPGTAFTYQGQLRSSGGQPVTDSCDFTFALFDDAGAGSQIGATLNKDVVTVTDSLFTVSLDFGSSAFDGADRWLEIAVRCPAGSGSFVTLSPRQTIQSVPYAVRAGSAASADSAASAASAATAASVPWSGVSGIPAGIADGDNQTLSLSNTNLSISGGNSVSLKSLGVNSSATGTYATVGGGNNNAASEVGATIGGGQSNVANIYNTTIAGGIQNTASGDTSTVGGGFDNTASGAYSTVAGGIKNSATGIRSAVGGGGANTVTQNYTTIAGGFENTASGDTATVGGGWSNLASGGYGTIAGGFDNSATGVRSTIGGGESNTTSGAHSTVGGGGANTASGDFSVVPGGLFNIAEGRYSFAAGRLAEATRDGSFVWADGANVRLESTATNQFSARAAGGFRFLTNTAHTTGCSLSAGSGSWNCTSDRNMKEQIETVDALAVLEGVAALPISTWNYTTQDATIRHMGPMAQDFAATFGLGEDDTTISMVDADGVSLAAIQGLYIQNQEQTRLIQAQQEIIDAQHRMLADLFRRIEALEAENE